MNTVDLLSAMTDLPEEWILEAGWDRRLSPVPVKKVGSLRVIRKLLIAAAILAGLGMSAMAAGYLLFDNPLDMLQAVLGSGGSTLHRDPERIADPEKPGENNGWIVPGFDRVSVDETLAEEEIVPKISSIGQTIQADGFTLTVDSFLYDNRTGCGLVTYSLVNPSGMPEPELTYDGCLITPNPLEINQYGYDYLIEDKTNDTQWGVCRFFRADKYRGDQLILSIPSSQDPDNEARGKLMQEMQQTYREKYSQEELIAKLIEMFGPDGVKEMFADRGEAEMAEAACYILASIDYDEQYLKAKITIPLEGAGNLNSRTFGNGAITATNLCITIDLRQQTGYEDVDYPAPAQTVIHYLDGTEFIVENETTVNWLFNRWTGDLGIIKQFNRIIDINQIASIELDNGLILTPDP